MVLLSIIIPVYNEEKTIIEILKRVENIRLPENIEKETIVVDNFSTDSTRNLLKKYEDKYKIIYHLKNLGKGSSVRTGIKHSSGDIILIQDADLEYNPAEYPKLLEPIMNGKTKVVYGTRLKYGSGNFTINNHFRYKLHYIGNIGITFIANILYGQKLGDIETGYKVFNSDVIKQINLRSKGFEIEPEITAKLLKKGNKILEIPIKYYSRSYSEGKKVSWKDGIKAAWYLLKYRFVD